MKDTYDEKLENAGMLSHRETIKILSALPPEMQKILFRGTITARKGGEYVNGSGFCEETENIQQNR